MRRVVLFLIAGLVLVGPPAARRAAATVATDICPANANPCVVSNSKNVTPGSTLDFGTRALDIAPSGSLGVVGGSMTILAGSLRIQQHGEIIGVFSANTTPAITVNVTGTIRIETGASGPGHIRVDDVVSPGTIDLHAGGDVIINGDLDANASNTDGSGGVINVVSDANLTSAGELSARASTFGLGGSINLMGTGTVLVSGLIRVDADDGGDIQVESVIGDITTTNQMNASGGGNFGDGGSVTLLGGRNLTVNGDLILQGAGSAIEGGGTGGDVDLETTAGAISVVGLVDNHGAAPDGDGGEVDAFAGTDVTFSGNMVVTGNGIDGCGGAVAVSTTRLFNLVSKVDLTGGFCGGDFDVDASTVTLSPTSDILADATFDGGSLSILAEQITAAGRLQATASSSLYGNGGLIQLAGCTIGIPTNATVKTDGDSAMNLIQASGQLTIGGQVSARPNGHNRIEYRDPTKPPITLGSASVQPTRDCAPAAGCLVPTLPPCATAAVCGNGTRESGEGCDDSNTIACDGCSAICQVEECGNRVIECGEECDDGPSNGGPGSPCDSTCHIVQSANMIFVPSSKHGNGCMLEFTIRHDAISGFPPSTIKCIDGDPTCDADGVSDGGCDFQVGACLNVTDARIPECQASAVKQVNLRRPSATDADDALEQSNADALVDVLRTLGVGVRSRSDVLVNGTPQPAADHCTAAATVRVLHPIGGIGRELISAGAENTVGRGVSNRTVLSCAANTAVCGNGVKEIGEQCDDHNTASCDGCSATCREERCGDGVVQCGEQCDDGAANGQPGSACSASCTETPAPNRIPGGSSSRDCLLEWSLATDQVATNRRGLPLTKQVCVDNTACDFDPTPGNCRIHLWGCVGADDSRLECVQDAIGTLSVERPRVTDDGFLGQAATKLGDAFSRLTLPAGPGEVCTPRTDLDIPAGKKKLTIKAEADSVGGTRDRDSLKITCAPAQ